MWKPVFSLKPGQIESDSDQKSVNLMSNVKKGGAPAYKEPLHLQNDLDNFKDRLAFKECLALPAR